MSVHLTEGFSADAQMSGIGLENTLLITNDTDALTLL